MTEGQQKESDREDLRRVMAVTASDVYSQADWLVEETGISDKVDQNTHRSRRHLSGAPDSGRSWTSAWGRFETFLPKPEERPLSAHLTRSVRSDTDYYI